MDVYTDKLVVGCSPAAGDRPLTPAERLALQNAAAGAVEQCGEDCGVNDESLRAPLIRTDKHREDKQARKHKGGQNVTEAAVGSVQ